MTKIIFAFIFLFFATLVHAKFVISTDNSGFPICATDGGKTYFFNWDHLTRAKIQTVFYFDKESYIHATGHFIKGCEDIDYMKIIPPEILIPIHLDAGIFPEPIHFALNQVVEGGHKFHEEKKPQDYLASHSKQFKFNGPEVLTRLNYEGGKIWAQHVMSAWATKTFSKNQICESFIGKCDFYLCQDKKNPCGIDGYNLSFGYKYCSGSQFSLLKNMQTSDGKKWVHRVISCLQKRNFNLSNLLNKNIPAMQKCERIESESFNSHPDCYVESGFCELPLLEKIRIASLIKNEIFTYNTFSEAANILKLCEEKL